MQETVLVANDILKIRTDATRESVTIEFLVIRMLCTIETAAWLTAVQHLYSEIDDVKFDGLQIKGVYGVDGRGQSQNLYAKFLLYPIRTSVLGSGKRRSSTSDRGTKERLANRSTSLKMNSCGTSRCRLKTSQGGLPKAEASNLSTVDSL